MIPENLREQSELVQARVEVLFLWIANPWVWVIEFERTTKEEAG